MLARMVAHGLPRERLRPHCGEGARRSSSTEFYGCRSAPVRKHPRDVTAGFLRGYSVARQRRFPMTHRPRSRGLVSFLVLALIVLCGRTYAASTLSAPFARQVLRPPGEA